MYYNRNLITAAKHEVTVSDGSGVFDLQAQAVFKSQDIWPGVIINDFVYTIDTSLTTGTTFTLRSDGTLDYTVDWGDNNSETSTSNTLAHTYASSGTYVIKINSNSGSYNPRFIQSGDEDQITSVAVGTNNPSVITSLFSAFYGANNLTSYTQIESVTSNVTSFREAWRNCSSLTSFPLIDVSSATNFLWTWRDCSSLTSFPLIDFSSATQLNQTWSGCSGLTSFPVIDTSSATNVGGWTDCTSLTSFPALDFSSMTYVGYGWFNCTSLATYPANVFNSTGTLASNAFDNAWTNCALTAQSIENILTSLDTNGASNITLGIYGGTSAGKTTWSTAANTAYNNLITKGWTISYNS